jgi:hypothetical protein
MNYLEGLQKLLSDGEIQYAGTMDITHEAEWNGYYPTGEWGLKMMTESMSMFGVLPFRFNIDFGDRFCKAWGRANTNAIYWLCIEPLDILTDLKLILKIGQTSAVLGLWLRFTNYNSGITDPGGLSTNIGVYKAMMKMGTSRVHVYYQCLPLFDTNIGPWNYKEKTTVNMLKREASHVAMYTADMGKKPIGNKQ